MVYQKGVIVSFGYVRVSTSDQELAHQLDALERAGCDEVLAETVSGTAVARPDRSRLLDKVRAGDTVVVWRLDRLGRSLRHLLELIEVFRLKGVELVSLHEQIDTTTATGKMMIHFFAMLAEFERNLISERTRAGLSAARARGRKGGRPPAITPQQLKLARAMLAGEGVTVSEVAKHLGVSRSTLYRHL